MLLRPLKIYHEFGIPLRMAIAPLPDRILSILHLHGFHTL
jgi:hypothetical protein